MDPELVICIPGMWADRNEFLRQVVTQEPMGRYMWAGMVLADIHAKDHIPLEFCSTDPNIPESFESACQGKLPPDVLAQLNEHTGVVYLHFPLDLPDQRERVLKFTQLIQRLGGIAVKLECAGVAHSWERWFTLLSGSPFDVYCVAVTLVADEDYYFSCGMHQFGLPECEAPRSIPVGVAADLMNRFNFWQITEHPILASGHSFSLTESDPHFRLSLQHDARHECEDAFHNPHGVWRLDAA
jgi:hypothetical protein